MSSNEDKTTVLFGDQTTLKKELQKALEQESCLIIIRGSPQGHRFFLTQDEMTIGRDPAIEITLNDQSVSRKHSLVKKSGKDVFINDLGSANGTYINNKKIEGSVKLAKEDMIKLGNFILKFLPAGELEILFYGNLGSAAHTDSLTGIYNRAYFTEALEAEFKRSKALSTELSIIYFDIDFFKKVNDGFGHDGGDFVLKSLTALIRAGHLRPKDVFARIGGEEFVIVLGNTAIEEAAKIAERIRASVETHAFLYETKRVPVTVSFGVASVRSEMESSTSLVRAADQALYQAKNAGRNRVQLAN